MASRWPLLIPSAAAMMALYSGPTTIALAGWPRSALEHDQVSDAREVREPVEQPPSETRRGDDVDVQH
jgi:hypothetical protein